MAMPGQLAKGLFYANDRDMKASINTRDMMP